LALENSTLGDEGKFVLLPEIKPLDDRMMMMMMMMMMTKMTTTRTTDNNNNNNNNKPHTKVYPKVSGLAA
jgi:hypothetical protein